MRCAELGERLDALWERIHRACRQADREQIPELIVVTKHFPADDVRRLYDLGVRDVGENKDQEASAKSEAVGALPGLQWHFVGQLQSKKAKSVARYATSLHSVDRLKLVGTLDRAASAALDEGLREQPLDCLLQVDLSTGNAQGVSGRGGAGPEQLQQLVEAVMATESLRVRGLMAVAPLHEPAADAFARLAELSELVQQSVPSATWISAGMSQDLEHAVAHGATHLRIGRDVLGQRATAG